MVRKLRNFNRSCEGSRGCDNTNSAKNKIGVNDAGPTERNQYLKHPSKKLTKTLIGSGRAMSVLISCISLAT